MNERPFLTLVASLSVTQKNICKIHEHLVPNLPFFDRTVKVLPKIPSKSSACDSKQVNVAMATWQVKKRADFCRDFFFYRFSDLFFLGDVFAVRFVRELNANTVLISTQPVKGSPRNRILRPSAARGTPVLHIWFDQLSLRAATSSQLCSQKYQ